MTSIPELRRLLAEGPDPGELEWLVSEALPELLDRLELAEAVAEAADSFYAWRGEGGDKGYRDRERALETTTQTYRAAKERRAPDGKEGEG